MPRFAASGKIVGQPEIQPQTQRLYRDVAYLTRLLRNPEHMDQLNQSADYIKAQWEKLGLSVKEQRFQVNGKTFRNLIVSIGPHTRERFVIGAHYDVYRDQPGADDNASGVAGLLELTRLLLENRPPLKTRLDLVAYTLEEQPYATLGSQMHVDQLLQDNIPVKGMISLEMIGYFSDQPNSQNFPSKLMKWLYPNKGNFIAAVGFGKSLGLFRKTARAFKRFSQMPLRSLWLPIRRFGVDRSDHYPFAQAGIPALMLTDTAEFRNQNYHQKTDTIYTLNFDKMAHVVKGVYGLVSQF